MFLHYNLGLLYIFQCRKKYDGSGPILGTVRAMEGDRRKSQKRLGFLFLDFNVPSGRTG